MYQRKIPEMAITRLSVYSRILADLDEKHKETISSEELASLCGYTSAQLRRDLAYFGQFGIPGKGYNVANLKREIDRILGINRTWNVAIVGAGNLGSALATYKKFKKRGFLIKAVFDVDNRKIGKKLGDVIVQDVKHLAAVVRKEKITIGMIAVPARAAAPVAEALVQTGVKAILNFAPIRISAPQGVKLVNADLTLELEKLSHFLTTGKFSPNKNND